MLTQPGRRRRTGLYQRVGPVYGGWHCGNNNEAAGIAKSPQHSPLVLCGQGQLTPHSYSLRATRLHTSIDHH